ncbi:hypothetical protein GQ43DRAFT_483842 [Delitschia confertaspora ATCC 74209]|uniref:Uncharacterized protein n=1 Tax=Delitschia confertaspora ATCC 74209 TaxID=1513339 RepID=A0A9P4JGZ3_9PLEO|nr:hypothetical protein GQ43DRAFT_483842 [Delitschia confertaspora ATCC 74209]
MSDRGSPSPNIHYHVHGGTFHIHLPDIPPIGTTDFNCLQQIMVGHPPPVLPPHPFLASTDPTRPLPPAAPQPPSGYVYLPRLHHGPVPPQPSGYYLPHASQTERPSDWLVSVKPNSPSQSSSTTRLAQGDEMQQPQVSDKYYYREYHYIPAAPFPPIEPPPPSQGSMPPPPPSQGSIPPPPGTVVSVPVPAPPPPPAFLVHMCSECGRPRSSRFHRENPITPKNPPTMGVCKRCQKKEDESAKENFHCVRKATHIKSCEAPEPCEDLGGQTFFQVVRNERDDHRGRERSRSHSSERAPYVRIRSVNRHRSRERSESRARIGFRTVRRESPSPPDISRLRIVERHHSPSPVEVRRVIRVIERARSPSPPPRPDTPPRYHESELPRINDAAARLAQHPHAYRPVSKDYHIYREGERYAFPSRSYTPSPHMRSTSRPRSILKRADSYKETSHRERMSRRRSAESIRVEIGDPRVHFKRDKRLEDDGSGYGTHISDRAPSSSHGYHYPEAPEPPLSGFRYVERKSQCPSTDTAYPHPPSKPKSPQRRSRYQTRVSDDEDTAVDDTREIVEVRKWRGLDDDGKPVTFVEERVTRPVLSGKGDDAGKPIPGSWRDV